MITGLTQILALFGNPVTHSLSPQLHEGWLADHDIDAAYIALALAHDDADATFRALKRVALHGANVTVPFKEAAAAAADIRSADVEALAAANVLQWDKQRGLVAHNTDAEGFVRALDEAIPAWRRGTDTALVVGAGGAGRAIAYGLAKAGVARIVVANRNSARAAEAVQTLRAHGLHMSTCNYADLADAFAGADLIVNATTIGLNGSPQAPWPTERALPHAIVCDVVYAPLETALLKAARARGLRAVDGLGMLIHQGALAFEMWFGIRPNTSIARERLLQILAARA